MEAKQLILEELLEELKQTPEQVQYQVLDFVRFLAHQRYQEELESQEDLEDAHAALADAKEHGTTAHDLEFEQGMEAYRKISSKYRNALHELGK